MVFFFSSECPFSIENAKFWPVLAILSRAYALFGAPCTMYRPKKCGGAPKMTNMMYDRILQVGGWRCGDQRGLGQGSRASWKNVSLFKDISKAERWEINLDNSLITFLSKSVPMSSSVRFITTLDYAFSTFVAD